MTTGFFLFKSRAKLIFFIFLSCFLLTCNDNETINQYTGEKEIYLLYPSSVIQISGTITISERRDGNTEFFISLKGTQGDIIHPVHLHYGDTSAVNPQIAIMLTSVGGKSGESRTLTNRFENGKIFTYAEIIDFDGHIRVHQDEVKNAKVVIAHGNIGVSN